MQTYCAVTLSLTLSLTFATLRRLPWVSCTYANPCPASPVKADTRPTPCRPMSADWMSADWMSADWGFADWMTSSAHRGERPERPETGRPPGMRAYPVLPKGGIGERTFGWLGRNRHISKDFERKVQTSETLIELAVIRRLVARLGCRT